MNRMRSVNCCAMSGSTRNTVRQVGGWLYSRSCTASGSLVRYSYSVSTLSVFEPSSFREFLLRLSLPPDEPGSLDIVAGRDGPRSRGNGLDAKTLEYDLTLFEIFPGTDVAVFRSRRFSLKCFLNSKQFLLSTIKRVYLSTLVTYKLLTGCSNR